MLSKEDYEQIYKMLDSVNPLSNDCGKLCNAVCCKSELYPQEEDYFLYLLLGEESVHDKKDTWLDWSEEKTSDFYLPSSWGEKFNVVRCHGPEKCKRKLRPIQCRTFPLEPHLSKDGELELIYCSNKTPYKCPLICDKIKLTDEFIWMTYLAWKKLISDKPIYDYIMMESLRHNYFWKKYRVVYSPRKHKKTHREKED